MNRFIEDFYLGKTEAQYWGAAKAGEFSEIMECVLSCKGRLADAIRNDACCDALACLEDYDAAWDDALNTACKNNFINGFRYGAGFCCDALCAQGEQTKENCTK